MNIALAIIVFITVIVGTINSITIISNSNSACSIYYSVRRVSNTDAIIIDYDDLTSRGLANGMGEATVIGYLIPSIMIDIRIVTIDVNIIHFMTCKHETLAISITVVRTSITINITSIILDSVTAVR